MMRHVYVALAVTVLIVYGGRTHEVQAAEAPGVVDWCLNICDDEASCTEPCLFAPPELPSVEITCGEYDGGPSNDHCNGNGCADECSWWSSPSDVCWWQNEETDCGGYGNYGICGDDVCVPSQDEDCESCEEDCGVCPTPPVCGNYICEYGETYRTCNEDCPGPPGGPGDCGDEVCDENEDGYICPVDCTFSGDWCGGFEECPEGWECIDDVCVWETDPVYRCCGSTSTHVCVGGILNCNVGEECKPMAGFPTPVCVPAWWTRPVVP